MNNYDRVYCMMITVSSENLKGPFLPEIIPKNEVELTMPPPAAVLAPSSTKIRLLKNSDDEPNRFFINRTIKLNCTN